MLWYFNFAFPLLFPAISSILSRLNLKFYQLRCVRCRPLLRYLTRTSKACSAQLRLVDEGNRRRRARKFVEFFAGQFWQPSSAKNGHARGAGGVVRNRGDGRWPPGVDVMHRSRLRRATTDRSRHRFSWQLFADFIAFGTLRPFRFVTHPRRVYRRDRRVFVRRPLKWRANDNISRCHLGSRRFFRPGNGSPSAKNVVPLVVLLVVISTKAFSFHNRSSSDFACKLVTTLPTIAPCRFSTFKLSPN